MRLLIDAYDACGAHDLLFKRGRRKTLTTRPGAGMSYPDRPAARAFVLNPLPLVGGGQGGSVRARPCGLGCVEPENPGVSTRRHGRNFSVAESATVR